MADKRLWWGAVLVVLALLWGHAWISPSTAQDPPANPPANDSVSTDPAPPGDITVDLPEMPGETASADGTPAPTGLSNAHKWSLLSLAVGIVVVLGLIIGLKVNAFIALITAAIVVSLMAPGDWSGKIGRVASSFGSSAGSIGIVIAMAAVIGKCMLDSGAADRVVRFFVNLFGEKRSPAALMGSGFVLAVPVFFDTVFYLLVPLARSLFRRTNKDYLKYILAIGAGGAITHTLVPPTPGPLMMASNLGFDVGIMIMIGSLVALPAAIAGLLFSGIMNRIMPVPMRQIGTEPEPEQLKDEELPSLFLSLLPVLLPVVMISTNTVLTTIADGEHAALLSADQINDWPAFTGDIRDESDAERPTPGGRIMETLHAAQAKLRKKLDRLGDAAADAPAQKQLEKLSAAVEALEQTGTTTDEQRADIVAALNQYVLGNKDFYDEEAFLGVRIDNTARSLLGQDRVRMKQVDAERMNRALLESAFNPSDPSIPESERQADRLIAPMVWNTPARQRADISSLFGNANLALLLSAVIAMGTLVYQRGLSWGELARSTEIALMSGGVIILITAGGGAFGDMLKVANVGDAIKGLFAINEDGSNAGLMFLVLGFAIAAVLKIAQGSSTVAMITGSAMLAGIAQPETLGYHPVYLATAIGGGSLVGSWMNDSGFWIFAKMGGLTETEALKSWTVMLVILGVVSFGVTVLLATVMPMV